MCSATLAGRNQIRRALETNGERVHARPPGCHPIVLIHAPGAELGGNRGDNGRIDTAGNQNAVGHIAHELAVNGGFQGRAQTRRIVRLDG